jgi:5-hydroxyisourate hydrolase
MSKLTTHVLDTANGCPAAGVKIEVWWISQMFDDRGLIGTTMTNADGRTDAPLLSGRDFRVGVYELIFDLGLYFKLEGEVVFLDRIPVRFGISDVSKPYHVPLLVSPWAYSTYRGS